MTESEEPRDRIIKKGSPKWEEIVAKLAAAVLLRGTSNPSRPSK